MKKFFSEFKKFITRGNVIDMAVGVIVGGAFTAIVTALTNQIFNPLVNWALSGAGAGLESAVLMLKPVLDAAGKIDMSKSIYIDWGAVISAILNFFIIAFILFTVVKALNALHEAAKPQFYGYTKKEYFAMRKEGKSKEQIMELAKARDEEAAAAKKAAEEEAKLHTTEGLLEQIKAILEKQAETEKKEKKEKQD